MITKESFKGPTPAGGARSEIYYFNDDGQPVDKAVATQAIIRELDKEGNILQETTAKI